MKLMMIFTWYFVIAFPFFPFGNKAKAETNLDHILREADFEKFHLPGGASDSRLKSWDPSDSMYEGRITCTSSKCVTIDEVNEALVTKGYPKRQNLELVFQARQRIMRSLGRLLPKFELNLGLGIFPDSIFSTISNLLGFIIPSNWFDWKESKLFYAAQKSSYVGLLRNLITDTEALYYNIHRVALDLEIYKYYADRLEKLIVDIESGNHDGKISGEDILMLKNFLGQIRADAVYLSTVISSWYSYDLAVAMAHPDLEEIGIRPLDIPDLGQVGHYPVSETDLLRIKEKSDDLRTLRYLIRAAHYSRLSRVFSFLSAGGSGRDSTIGISFGLDNIAEIRIAGSEKKYLEIQKEEATAKLESTFRILVDVYNGATDLYNKYSQAKGHNRALFYSVLGKYSTEKTLDVEKLIRAIDWALKFELGRNFVVHLHLMTKSQMDRLLVIGKRYEDIPRLTPANGKLNPRINVIKIKENQDIERDIKKGVLDLENP